MAVASARLTLAPPCGVQGTTDAMRPPNPIEVPLWLALFFKKRDKCRISPPEWLEPEVLEQVLSDERGNPGAFAEIPFHYVEVAKDLLECAADDLPNVHRIRSLLKDIEDVRRGKVERGLKNFDQNTTSVKLKNLSAMELNRIRTVATKSLDEFRTFDAQRPEEQEEPTQRASQPASSAGPGNAQLQEALQRRAERR
jgi:GINS complex subunit 2